MFLGQHGHTLDDKNRITLPARFRAQLERGVVITKGLDQCLWVFPLDEWEGLANKADALPLTDRDGRDFVRSLFGNAIDAVPDRQGRVLIPDYLLQHAGITTEAMVVGANRRFEIWSRQLWDAKQAAEAENREAMVDRWQKLGI